MRRRDSCGLSLSGQLEVTEAPRYAGINGESLVHGIYTQNVPGYVDESLRSGTGQSAVLRFAGNLCICAGRHGNRHNVLPCGSRPDSDETWYKQAAGSSRRIPCPVSPERSWAPSCIYGIVIKI